MFSALSPKMLYLASSSALLSPPRCIPQPQMSANAQSRPVPWLGPLGGLLERPQYLDGSLAGDVGFDPLGFCVKALPRSQESSTDSPSEYKLRANLMWMREAEVKHSRLAMLAAAGWPIAELWHGSISSLSGLPFGLDATQGRSLSVLNGHLLDVAPFLVLATIGMVAIEVSTLDQVYGLTSTGKTMSKDGRTMVMKSYVPGDCGFDPLNLYDTLGSQVPVVTQMQMDADPEVRAKMNSSHFSPWFVLSLLTGSKP